MKTRGGFTLFELLAVITIIGIVLAVTLGSFQGWGDSQAVRGSADIVEAALEHARDYAVSQHVPVSFRYETGISTTNGIKKVTVFQIVRESNVAVATNLTLSAIDDSAQLLGTAQRLPGSAWLVPHVPLLNVTDNAWGCFVFLPNGKVCNPQTAGDFRLSVVSRKMRGGTDSKTPNIIYQIDLDPANGTVTVTKRNSEEFPP
jgi:prepilin-type N-terminal cleavage/methylation domain-containing protein